MSITDKLSLGINTTIIGMGIVMIVLIALCFVIMLESKVIGLIFRKGEALQKTGPEGAVEKPQVVERKGITSGETVVKGVEGEETLAMIMAAVSNHAEIPLKELKFKSIKALN